MTIEDMDVYWFKEVALRGHILLAGDEQWTVTPFNKKGEPCGEPLVIAEFYDIEGWIERTPIICTEAELPERIKQLDVYGRPSDEERAAQKGHAGA